MPTASSSVLNQNNILKWAIAALLSLVGAYAQWSSSNISDSQKRLNQVEQRLAGIDAKLDLLLQEWGPSRKQ